MVLIPSKSVFVPGVERERPIVFDWAMAVPGHDLDLLGLLDFQNPTLTPFLRRI